MRCAQQVIDLLISQLFASRLIHIRSIFTFILDLMFLFFCLYLCSCLLIILVFSNDDISFFYFFLSKMDFIISFFDFLRDLLLLDNNNLRDDYRLLLCTRLRLYFIIVVNWLSSRYDFIKLSFVDALTLFLVLLVVVVLGNHLTLR